MEKDYQKIAKLYKEVQELHGLNQEQFALKLGISQAYLSQILLGKKNPAGDKIMEIMELRRKVLIRMANL